MSHSNESGVCAWCKCNFEINTIGRPRKYCCNTCKQRAYEHRLQQYAETHSADLVRTVKGNKFTDITVTLLNFMTRSYRLSYTYRRVRLYDDFKTREEAEFWADALKAGLWRPLNAYPTEGLRERIERAQND